MPNQVSARVVVSGGGTGGHIYPALAVASALQCRPTEAPHRPSVANGGAQVLYLHGPGRIDEEVLAHSGLERRRLDVGPIRGTGPVRLTVNTARLIRATLQAAAAIGTFRANVVMATGGYVSVPAILGARMRGVPVVLYLPDASPGLAVRMLAPLARRIALSFPLSRRYFPSRKAIVTGYPVRPEFLTADREHARRSFDLTDEVPVVMVMGGSSGAHSINLAVSEGLEPLIHHAQVIHLCGDLDEQRLRGQRAALDPAIRSRYHLYRYLHRGVSDAMAASDLIVCRAGASVMAELPIMRLPAVLVPHPFARIRQDENADFLVQQGGAAKIPDNDLPSGALLATVLSLLADRAQLEKMAAAMGRLARPEAASNIAALVRSVAKR
jgi:UDP-N-acetylglucosamine--N-acetylmuramyl-(pentapeptide) pyrophosphoryl-undecaprenol N-acetylglucosamine transferase